MLHQQLQLLNPRHNICSDCGERWLRWLANYIKTFVLIWDIFISKFPPEKFSFQSYEVISWCQAKKTVSFRLKIPHYFALSTRRAFVMIYLFLFQIFKVTFLKEPEKEWSKKIKSCFFIEEICDSILLDHFLPVGNSEWEDKNAKVK